MPTALSEGEGTSTSCFSASDMLRSTKESYSGFLGDDSSPPIVSPITKINQ